ncbi:hypothetical protein JK358_11800 [Nocardia sp. 2]|uniref:Novel STAND NTPase 1 domain-containing protein n=1 Tax=Nocardia acididurans TaxID=2802282 RepID=A0ABS1M336_9NOCA|nr:hypothetical protein [Nocardia acididurans]MBL1075077.1 hypothetical protein [Nocardia acididurans]
MLAGEQPNTEPSALESDSSTDPRTHSPRALFTQRFTDLYAAAGNPTLRRVATAAESRMRAAHGNRPGGASAQRISDWKSGRNVPARFESLLPVVLTLIDLARTKGTPLTRELAEPKEWQRLWHAATTWNPEEQNEAACPYPGLNSYRPENRELFFGRARATTELADLVRDATGIVAVVGASGAGKSSLLAAGLVPALPDWEVVSLTPGPHPLETLLHAATPAETEEPVAADDQPGAEHSIDDAARGGNLAPRPDRPRRLLVVDQFEELFTLCTDESERERILDTLHTCATRTVDPLAVVIALRADFYAHCLDYPVLQDALERRAFLLGPMRLDELAQAVSGPARAAGLELEPGLEELVITELCGVGDHRDRRSYDPGALPLLSHVMAATWQHREGRRLTINGYRKAGGVTGSVTETAESAWSELSSTQQAAAREILLGLVTVSQDAQDTRRFAHRSDLLTRAAHEEDAAAALELLSRTRLVTLDAESVTLTHEIVLTAWPRLRAWIDEDRVGYLVRQRLAADAAEWAAQERDSALLYRGSRLQNTLDHVCPPPVGPLAHEFLTAAAAARDQGRRRSTGYKAVLALLAVILLVLGFAAFTQTRLALQQRDDQRFAAVLAEADRLRETDPSLAAQLYLVARQLRPDHAELRSRLFQTQNRPLATTNPAHDSGIWRMAYRTGGVLATVGFDDNLRLWDVTDPYRPSQLGRPLDDNHVAFSPDGGLMATSGGDHNGIRLWDTTVPASPRELSTMPEPSGPGSGVMALTFADNGRVLVTVTTESVTLWDLSNTAAPTPGAPHHLYRDKSARRAFSIPVIAVSPDGRVLAVSYDADDGPNQQWVRLLNVAGGATPTVLNNQVNTAKVAIRDMEFSPDGNTLVLATAGGDSYALGGTKAVLHFWDVSDRGKARQLGAPLTNGVDEVQDLAFSPDGRVLAVASRAEVSLWNVTEPAFPTLITNELSVKGAVCRSSGTEYQCDGGAYTVAFTPDGRSLLTGNGDGKLRTWALPSSVLTGHAGELSRPRMDAVGDRMTTVSSDGRIAVWDIRNRQLPVRIGEYRLPPDRYQQTLSPDGRTMLVTGPDRSATGGRASVNTMLDLSDPQRIRPIDGWQQRLDQGITASMSPDWRMMATVENDSSLQLWDLTDRSRPTPIGAALESPDIRWAVFSPDRKTLLVQQQSRVFAQSGNDLVISRWDITDPQHPQSLGEMLRLPGKSFLTQVVYTHDLNTLLVTDGTEMSLWDISDPARPLTLGNSETEGSQQWSSVRISADDRQILVSTTDNSVQLWDFTDRSRPRRVGSPLLEPGKARFLVDFHPDGRFIAGAADDGMLRLWDLDEQRVIDHICAITGGLWTRELWRSHLPDLEYNPPCGQ